MSGGTTVPLSLTEKSFPHRLWTGNVDHFLLKIQTSVHEGGWQQQRGIGKRSIKTEERGYNQFTENLDLNERSRRSTTKGGVGLLVGTHSLMNLGVFRAAACGSRRVHVCGLGGNAVQFVGSSGMPATPLSALTSIQPFPGREV